MPTAEGARWSFHRVALDRKLDGRAAFNLPTRSTFGRLLRTIARNGLALFSKRSCAFSEFEKRNAFFGKRAGCKQPVKNAKDLVAISKKLKPNEKILIRVWSQGRSGFVALEPK